MPILITDFDGTMTQRDFYRVALECLVPPATPDYWAEYLGGRMTHFQAMQAIMGRVRGSEATVLQAITRMVLDPRAGEAVRRLQAAGWEVRVASAGCRWYIDYLLGLQDIHVPVYANPGTYHPDRGLEVTAPVASPYYCPETGIDKLGVVRAALADTAVVAFAGDGPPDLAPTLAVSPAFRFARGYLAEALTARSEAFTAFARWSDLAELLTA